jgi:hypothetical protein
LYLATSREVLEQQREEILREAELNRKSLATPRRAAALLGKSFGVLKNAAW